MDKYTGYGDPFLSFTDFASDFSKQGNFDRTITITVFNASSDDQTVILFPSRKPENAARVLANTIVYQSGKTDLTAEIDKNTIAELHAQIMDEPIWLLHTKVMTNTSATGTKKFEYITRDVFNSRPQSRTINFVKGVSQYATDNNIFDVAEPLLLSSKHELQTVIPATKAEGDPTTYVTFIFSFGVSLSIADALAAKTSAASKAGYSYQGKK